MNSLSKNQLGISPAPQQSVAEFSLTQTMHQGPLPDPDTLNRYEQMMPGSAERIFRIAEKEQEHRHTLERMSLEGEIDHQAKMRDLEKFRLVRLFSSHDKGVMLATGVAVIALFAAVWSIYFGAGWWATAAFLGFPVAAIIDAIRSGTRHRKMPGDEESKQENKK